MAHPKRIVAQGGNSAAYDIDLAAWSLEQAANLRKKAWSRLDLAHLIDEVEAVARTERNALTRSLRVILLHMLKWDHQPSRRTRSWSTSIRVQRIAVLERLEDSPSLSQDLPEAMNRAYRKARLEAAGETGLDERVFSEECPFDFDATMSRNFPWPPATVDEGLGGDSPPRSKN